MTSKRVDFMGETSFECGKCQKKFVVGLTRSAIMTLRCMGIEDMAKIFEHYKKIKDLCYENQVFGYKVNYRTEYLRNCPNNCPYCNADKTYFIEGVHFI